MAAAITRAGSIDETQTLTTWLVLALVIEQPSHGYEIHQRYESRFGAFLPTSKPSIYPILDRLAATGMVEAVELEPLDGSRKQHRLRRSYRATRGGVEAYRRWAAERLTDDPQRTQILARIASVGLLGADAVLEVIDRYQSERIHAMKGLPTSDPDVAHGDVAELLESLVVDKLRRETRASIDWAVHARRVVQAYAKRSVVERSVES
ncbi:MAG: PadR family transcriptional regulator [Solirubrobacteraceae bacterium]